MTRGTIQDDSDYTSLIYCIIGVIYWGIEPEN